MTSDHMAVAEPSPPEGIDEALDLNPEEGAVEGVDDRGGEGLDEAALALQLVTFQVAKETFGISMASVLEIIRVPDTVAVPMTPSALQGLANLRGRVLPVLDLRRVLALEERPLSDSSRVVVTDVGYPVGLIVDHVQRVLSVDEAEIQRPSSSESVIDSDLLKGVVRAESGLIQLLDVHEIIQSEFQGEPIESTSRAVMDEPRARATLAAEGEPPEEDVDPLVSFLVDGQEYAFELRDVEGILRVPDAIVRVPRSASHALGLVDIRGRLVPLVSLRRMLALTDAEVSESNRILLVNLPDGEGNIERVGLVVDQVREVLRVPTSAQEELPGLLRSAGSAEEIDRICRLGDGRRLVSVMNSRALFHHPAIRESLDSTREAEASDVHLQSDTDRAASEETVQLVVFTLSGQEYGVPIDHVQEITRIPEKMDRVPKTAGFIEGMVNLRGTVLPVVDMRVRFAMNKMDRNDRQRIIVLQVDSFQTGFIVDSVTEVLRLSSDQIETAPDLSQEQTRILGHVVNLRDQQRLLQALTVAELLNRAERAELRAA